MCYHLFEGSFLEIFLLKILLPFLKIPYLKTDVTSLLTLFFVKDFKEKEVEFWTELPFKNDNIWALPWIN